MAEPRNITVGEYVFAIVNEVDNGNTVIFDAVAPDGKPLSVALLKSRSSDFALGPVLVASWGQTLSTRRSPL